MAGVAGGQGENQVTAEEDMHCRGGYTLQKRIRVERAAKGDGVTGERWEGRLSREDVSEAASVSTAGVSLGSEQEVRSRGLKSSSQHRLGAQHPAFTGKDLCKNLILIRIVQTLEKRFFSIFLAASPLPLLHFL